ncbi:MAG: AMP-binding protein [Desulfobacula sp.]|nr:AMP-binding protein [Desulfobacula sp.]
MNIALIDGKNHLPYQELNDESNKIASSLQKMGVKPGEHIALCVPNSYSWIVFLFWDTKVGAVAITLPYPPRASCN